MGFTALDATSLEVGKRITNELMVNIKNDLDYLYGELSGQVTYNGLISNGGFEMDADADGRPDNWDISLFTGGGATLVSTATGWASPTHGSKTLCIDKPAGVGNGGALVMSDYFAVSSETLLDIGMMLYSNTSSVINKVAVYTYDKDRTFSTSINLYGSKPIVPLATANESTYMGRDLRMVAALSNGRGGASPRWARIGITAGSTEGASSGKTFIDRVYVNDNSFPNVTYSHVVTSWAEIRKTITAGSTGGIELSVTTVGPVFGVPRIYGNTTMLVEFSMNVNCGFQQTGTTGGTDPPKWKLYIGLCQTTSIMTDHPKLILDDSTVNISTGTVTVVTGQLLSTPYTSVLYGYSMNLAIKGSRGYEGYDFWNPAESYGATFITAKPDNKITIKVIDPDL